MKKRKASSWSLTLILLFSPSFQISCGKKIHNTSTCQFVRVDGRAASCDLFIYFQRSTRLTAVIFRSDHKPLIKTTSGWEVAMSEHEIAAQSKKKKRLPKNKNFGLWLQSNKCLITVLLCLQGAHHLLSTIVPVTPQTSVRRNA